MAAPRISSLLNPTALTSLVLFVLLTAQLTEGLGWPFFPRRSQRGFESTTREKGWDYISHGAAYPPPLPLPDTAAREHSRALLTDLEAKGRLSLCWKQSLVSLQKECVAINADDALRSRLALAMAACDGEGDGRGDASAFRCEGVKRHRTAATGSDVGSCVQALSESAYTLFVQYRLHTDVLCAYLQEEVFQQRTEAAVMSLQTTAMASAQSMESLKDSSVHLLVAVREGQAAQRRTQSMAAELQAVLGSMQDGQARALEQLQSSAATLHAKAESARQSLIGIQDAVTTTGSEAVSQLHILRDLATDHYDAMERRTSGLLRVLSRVEEVQNTLKERSFTTHELLKYIAASIAVLLLTTPKRTASARLPALALVAAGWLGPLFLQPLFHYAVPWFAVSAVAVSATLYGVGRAYRSPAQLQRQIIREELVAAFAHHNPPAQQHPLVRNAPLTLLDSAATYLGTHSQWNHRELVCSNADPGPGDAVLASSSPLDHAPTPPHRRALSIHLEEESDPTDMGAESTSAQPAAVATPSVRARGTSATAASRGTATTRQRRAGASVMATDTPPTPRRDAASTRRTRSRSAANATGGSSRQTNRR